MNLTKKFISHLAVFLLFSGLVFSQTVHQVAAGTDVLKAAIDAAADGDIIELTTDGGVYLSADQIDITKSITIRAANGLAAKPVLKYNGSSTSAHMFRIRSGPNVTFEGLDLAGDGTAEGGAKKAKYILRIDSSEDPTTDMVIKVDNCLMHDTQDKIIKPYKQTGIDSLIIHNTTFYNSDKEGITLNSGSSSDPAVDLLYAEFYNCTFYNTTREAIKGDVNLDTKVRINHCTFYNIGGADKPFIYMDDITDVEIKNSIFQKNLETGNFVRLENDDNLFHHNIFWDVVDHDVDNTVNVSDTLFADPLFEDPENANFMLGAGSPALGFADDGKGAGDLRWDPNAQLPEVHEVASGTDVLKAAIDAAADGDIIELTTSGGMYLSNDQIDIRKSITIRAKEFLAEKPVLKYIGESTSAHMFRIHSGPKVTFEGLDLAGDGTAEGGAKKAKYILRIDSSEDSLTAMVIKIDDCLIHDSQDKLVKPYKNTGIDSLIIHNTTFYNSDKEGITLNSGSSSDPKVHMDYAEFYNCTFYNTRREAIKGDTNPDTKVLINQCTFYDIGGADKPFIYIDDHKDVEIKNSIFQKNLETGNFVRLESDENSFHHNVFWDVNDKDVDNTSSVYDTLFADPLFADPANANFTLGAGSPARTAAEGGTPAGDLRWAINPNAVILTVLTEGNGIVTLDPPGNIYDPGTSVTLTAVPDAGWKFVGWTGVTVFPPDNPVATVTVNSNMSVTASFISTSPQVTLTVDSLGLGSVAFAPAPNAAGTYDEGTIITLTATAKENWHFVEWLGDLSGSENPISFALDSNMTITGSFASDFEQVKLYVSAIGKGNVTVNPEPILGSYDINTVVKLTATPELGWQFDGFTGHLVSSSPVDSVKMTAIRTVTAKFSEIKYASNVMEIDTTIDLYDAVMIANNNSIINTIMLGQSGVYTSTNTSDVQVRAPLTIMAKPGLDSKPIVTNSDVEQSNIDIFRVFDDFTLKGVVVDGGHAKSHGMKYGIRMRDYDTDDMVKDGANITCEDVDFVNIFEKKNPGSDGHAFKIDIDVRAGAVKFLGCTFKNLGYEAIRISDTEKWPTTDRALDTLIVRNCTFINIDAEGIRYYSDAVDDTPDAPVIIEHCTFDNTATRVMFLKNSGGAIVRDIIISNSRPSGHGRDDDLMDAQGTSVFDSFVSHVDTFNVKPVPVKSSDGIVDETTIYGIDPEYVDQPNGDYTLKETSHLYGLASDGLAMGDLRWATNISVNVMLSFGLMENGNVVMDPMPIGITYSPNTVVNVTAVPDSGYMFIGWEGDLSGNDNPAAITMDANKSVTAIFDVAVGVEDNMIPTVFSIDQNYPNPFNPTTSIRFGLPENARVTLQVFDILGRLVNTLYSGTELSAGYHSVNWNGDNIYGSKVATGIYFYRINSVGVDNKNFTDTKKMIMMK